MTRDEASGKDLWGAGVIRLHWIMVPLVAAALATGYAAEHGASGRAQHVLYEVHFSIGLVTLLALVLRVGCRVGSAAPIHPALPAPQRFAARTVHLSLYGTMVAALASGWTNFMFLGPVRVFGVVEIPRLFDPEAQEPLRALSWYVHYYSYWLLLPLVGVHVGAALLHHFVLRDRVLIDFLPGR